MKPYPAYRDSGIEWLGEVPEHWEVKRLKTAARYWISNVDKVPSEDELPVRLCNYTDVYRHEHICANMSLMETTATAEEIRRFALRAGDVVITKDSEAWSDIAVPALVTESAPDLLCGYHLAIIRPESAELDSSFLLRVLQSCAVNQQFQVAATGVTRYGIPKTAIGDAWAPLPPLPEQRAIAAFLDRETGKLDALIEKKRALIELLKEKRSALISRTVTRGLPPEAARAAGLDPHPKFKPSGVEWLGEVPEHWGAKRLKYVSSINDEALPESTPPDLEIAYVDISNVQAAAGIIGVEEMVFEDAPSRARRIVRDGDTIVSTVRTYLRAIAPIRAPRPNLIVSTGFAVVRPRSVDPGFLFYALCESRFVESIVARSVGVSYPAVNASDVGAISVPLPPLPEQRAIAAFLDRETAKLDQMSAKVEEAVARLQEYRAALITAAVTGKIDVRGVNA